MAGHKEDTLHKDIVTIRPVKEVYIPLNNGTAKVVDVYVNEGDHVHVGTLLAARNDTAYVPIYSSVSGIVKGKKNVMHPVLKPYEHLIIEDDHRYTKVEAFKPINPDTASPEDLVEFTKQAGIVGCGGAGFPTYIKYSNPAALHTVIINAVECEPYITADYVSVDESLELLLAGTKAMFKMAQANQAVIAIKKTKKALIKKLEALVADESAIMIYKAPDVYPMGWERTLIYDMSKKRYDRLPSELGYVVNNATTAIALARAIRYGEPLGEKIITMAGSGLKTPTNVRVPFGIKVSDIVAQIGGYAADDVLMIAGGPMMGKTIPTDEFAITNYANAITILKNEAVEDMACMRCGKCNDACPAGLLPVRINNAEKAKDLDAIATLQADRCIECGLCTYVCPSKIDVTEGVRRAKRVLALRKA
jgi:electron transport complex protein RnfC